MIIAIIPARGGSTRLPRKNIRELKGKPLISYSIDACKNSGLVDKIIVSSEDKEVLDISENLGAVPHLRPKKLAIEVTNNELAETKQYVLSEFNPSQFLFLLPTYPFRSIKLIKDTIEHLKTSKYVISQTILRQNGLELLSAQPEKGFSNLLPEGTIVQRNSYLNAGNSKPFPDSIKQRYYRYNVNEIENIDIDTPLDWVKAELVIEKGLYDFSTGEVAKWPINF